MDFNFREELAKIAPKIKNGAKIYIFGAGSYWRIIMNQYKVLVNIDINDFVYAFVDNDKSRHGTDYFGKPIISPDEIDLDNAVILISAGIFYVEIGLQLRSMGLYWNSDYFDASVFENLLMRYGYLRLLQFKNKHTGRRCFIIGNGPSLKAEDLDLLKDEITFASNRIYLMFDKTVWRPTYYAITDDVAIRRCHNEVNKYIDCPVFFSCNNVRMQNHHFKNGYYYYIDFHIYWKPAPFNKPLFSDDAIVLHAGMSVTYEILQLAAYMGFSEIILLGVDNSFSLAVKADGTIIHNKKPDFNDHFDVRYDFASPLIPQIDLVTSALQSAKEYADSHGFKIYNATRGGNLDIFERIDLDKCIKHN